MTMVRPCAMRSRLSFTAASLSGSSALVGLVENQDARVVDQRARDRETLALSARKVRRALFDISFVAVRHALDEFLGARETCSAHGVCTTSVQGARR